MLRLRSRFANTLINAHVVIEPSTDPSKALRPEWLAVASQTGYPLVSIDCTKEVELCREQDVTSCPAIRLFKKGGTFVRYRGPRKASEIVAFINRSKLSKLSTLNCKNITAFQSAKENIFIAYLASDDHNQEPNIATIAAQNSDRFTFGLTYDPNAATLMKASIPSIVCYRSDGGSEVLLLPTTIYELEEFVEKATAALVGEMTRRNELKYMKSGKSLVYILSASESERAEFQQDLKPLAKKYKEYLHFVTIDAVEYEAMARALGVKTGKLASLAVQNPLLGQVFLYPDNQRRQITPDIVEAFVMDIVDGKVQPNGDGEASDVPKHQEL